MKFHVAINAIIFATILIRSCKNHKESKEKTNHSMMKKIKEIKKGNVTVNLFDNKIKESCHDKSDLKHTNSKYDENNDHEGNTYNIHEIGDIMQNKTKPIKKEKTKYSSSKIKKNTSRVKQKIVNNTKIPRTSKRKEKGRVFKDTREDIMHYKLIDNMMFKPLDSNNSVSISFSDESEITQAEVDQAIEGRDGSCIAIPVKRKKDIYKEFLRWAHVHEKNERKAKIEKEIVEKYKNNTKNLYNGKISNSRHKTNVAVAISGTKNSSVIHKAFSKDSNISNQHGKFSQGLNQSTFIKTNTNLPKSMKQSENIHNEQTGDLKKKKLESKFGTKGFKAESVELKYDPEFLNKLHNSVKEQKEKYFKRKRKKKIKKPKQRQTYEGNPADISADDYSAQEAFVINTQKEAMGRRYYQMFVNKTASDFWDNSTLETTKMLEFLIPLGEHLHKTLEEPPPNQGNNFIVDLQMYKTELEKFIVLVKKDKAETRQDVVALLEEPYEHVCETKYSEEEIKIMFGWEDNEFEQFEKLLEETREMWFDLQLFHHCYQFVSESAESYNSGQYNYTKDEICEIIQNNTWHQS